MNYNILNLSLFPNLFNNQLKIAIHFANKFFSFNVFYSSNLYNSKVLKVHVYALISQFVDMET